MLEEVPAGGAPDVGGVVVFACAVVDSLAALFCVASRRS